MRFVSHNDVVEMDRLLPAVFRYQELATAHGISDIFQDNGGKILQVCLLLGLTANRKRMGNDATDSSGQEYELKTVNITKTTNFTTHHHLNHIIIAKYRTVPWIFSTYENILLKDIYILTSNDMEEKYREWERKLQNEGISHINNPKIPLSFVMSRGRCLYRRP